MYKFAKIPLILEPQKEGGWTIKSPLLPELITEIDDMNDLYTVVMDALEAVIELYKDTGREFPLELVEKSEKPIWFESLLPLEK